MRTTAFVVGGAGVAALAAGGYFAVRAKNAWSDRNTHCPPRGCDEFGVTAAADAKADVVIATGAFTIGLLEVAAATYLLIRGDQPPQKPPRTLGIGVADNQVFVRGLF
jgi:hypothetical protein